MLDPALPFFEGRRQSLYAVSEQTSCTTRGASEAQHPLTLPSSMLHHAKYQDTVAVLESSYLRDVLQLPDGDTEERLDSELRIEAGDSGDETYARIVEEHKAHRTKATSSDLSRRSQESVASKMSQSTGVMSNISDVSKDHYTHPAGRNRYRASLSFRDYDAFLARGTPSARQSISFSPPTTPSQSTFSLPLSSPESSPRKHFSRIRGLSMLRLHRTTSSSSLNNGCPHCPQGSFSQRRAVHKLPCGHRLCTQALRDLIKAGMDQKTGAVPSCCGTPIPGNLVEHAMTQDEQTAFLEKLGRWDASGSIPDATGGADISSTAQRPGALSSASRTISDESKVDSVNPQAQKDVDRLMELPDYKQMRADQAETRDRFLRWIEKQRSALDTQHQKLREELKQRHEASLEELLERHNVAMCEAEDKQVKAEADMRHGHSQEKRDNATALKHMEAYCAGTYSTGEPHMRTVTEPDRAELDKTRRARDQMDTRHGSAINVLRGEQGRRMKLRAQRQGREEQELGRAQRREELELERVCGEAVHQLDDMVAEKRQRLRLRWQLQTAIFMKKVEKQTGTSVRARLPSIEWQPVVKAGPDVIALPTSTVIQGLEKTYGLQLGKATA